MLLANRLKSIHKPNQLPTDNCMRDWFNDSSVEYWNRGSSSSFSTNLIGSLSGSDKWAGGVLAPNGKIYGIPYDSSSILEIDTGTVLSNEKQPVEWVCSPYVNKF